MSGRAPWDLARLVALGSMLAPPLAPLLSIAALIDARGAQFDRTGETFDAVVVAGCRVGHDGTPSAALRRRCALAARLYAEGVAPKIVVTGGSIGGRPAEADVAAALLEEAVPGALVVRERRSRRTEENAAETARVLGASARVLVVTDSYHVLRCRRVFSRHFVRAAAIGSVGAPGPRLRGAVREVFALAADVARSRRASKFAREVFG